jgi:hypothetical protein
MKRLLLFTILPVLFVSPQTFVNPYFGFQTGLNYSIFDPKDEAGNLTGLGFQFGLGMGIEFLNTFDLEIAPSFRTTSFERTVLNIETGADFKNFYIPFIFKLRAGTLPVVNPYLGLGIAGNFQIDGTAYVGSFKSSIDDLENDLLFLVSVGTDIKLAKIKMTPDFKFNYNLTADDPDTEDRSEENYDFHFSFGISYAP